MIYRELLNTTLWTAIVTPLNDNGEVNYAELATLLRMQEKAGNGIVILGSTGESLNISEQTKENILTFVLSLHLIVPLMVGVGGSCLPETKRFIERLNGLNVDAYLVGTPLYAKPGTMGQYLWFKELLDASTRPVMLYNVPGRTAVKMSFEAVEMLKDHPNLFGIKEASGSCEDFARYVSISPDIAVYSGDDALLPSFRPIGARGLVSVAGNVWPEETHLYVERCLAGDLSPDEQRLWEEASASLFIASNPVPVKRLLWQTHKISTPRLLPPLHHADCDDDSVLVGYNTKIQEWFETQKVGAK